MKRVLITGASGYIGTSLAQWLARDERAEGYQVEQRSVRGDDWKESSFAGYDVIVHTAGIAHRKENKENALLYEQVNRDLTVELAQKAKREGVKQFIFFSSMSVYGKDTGVITADTEPRPTSYYGKSKLEAEQRILTLEDPAFSVVILRPPMVYGPGCHGNFQTVVKIVKKFPVFPSVKNQRSMLYIDHLCAFLQMMIDGAYHGVFFPQNSTYTNTTEMARHIAKALGRRVYMSVLLGWAVRLMQPFTAIARKAFGTLIYQDVEQFDYCYCTVEAAETFRRSV